MPSKIEFILFTLSYLTSLVETDFVFCPLIVFYFTLIHVNLPFISLKTFLLILTQNYIIDILLLYH